MCKGSINISKTYDYRTTNSQSKKVLIILTGKIVLTVTIFANELSMVVHSLSEKINIHIILFQFARETCNNVNNKIKGKMLL